MSLRKSSTRRNRERGSVLLVAMIALVALVLLGSLTIVTVRSSLSGSTHERFKAVALSAAEAGIAVGINYARQRFVPGAFWSDLVDPEQIAHRPLDLPGNAAQPGQAGNIFHEDARAWFEVEFLNNVDDGSYVGPSGSPPECANKHVGYCQGNDTDGRIIIRSTGHGPNNAAVRLEVEIMNPAVQPVPCNTGDSTNSGNSYCGGIGNTSDQVAR